MQLPSGGPLACRAASGAEALLRLLQALAPGLGLAAALLWVVPAARRAGGLASRRRGRGGEADPLWETCGLRAEEVERFSRQLVLPKLRVEGQRELLRSRVLIVGAGGLGCPVAIYLCGAGVGALGIADGDEVAVSNLHRQVGHNRHRVGENKAVSLRQTCLDINDLCNVVAYPRRLSTVLEAAELIRSHDLIIDCTDAPGSRYLLNEAALAAGKPLLAASAVGLSGQIAVYGLPGGPCLRCVFPTAPGSADAAEPVANCEESGVLGPICGAVGTLAAVEAVKLLAGGALANSSLQGRLLLFDALDSAQPCRTMKIKKRAGCPCCEHYAQDHGPVADTPQPSSATCGSCGAAASTASAGEGLGAASLRQMLRSGSPTVLLDVRQPLHFSVAHLAGAVNWPLTEMRSSSADELRRRAAEKLAALQPPSSGAEHPLLICTCRRGVDSLTATRLLREAGVKDVWNLDGGLRGFAATTEAGFERPVLT